MGATTGQIRRSDAVRRLRAGVARRRKAAIALGIAALAGIGALVLTEDPRVPLVPDRRGTPEWLAEHYGNPDAKGYRKRNITEIEFLGRTMFVHRKAARHFLRLERIFEARAPEYAAAVAAGTLDDWSYNNRPIRGGTSKSHHAYGLAVDVNALTNVMGTPGDMPDEVVRQWEIEGGEWGGDWSRPDPMHFETHLTPKEIRQRYHSDGTVKEWYLDELTS